MEEDERREAAIASAACLNPRPSSSVSQARISKFQELHKRRLQIKEKSKIKKRSKGKSSGSRRLEVKDHAEAGATEIQCKAAGDKHFYLIGGKCFRYAKSGGSTNKTTEAVLGA